ncbi:MAG: amino acid permease [Actinobacteria bacterium]|nr:MAG: amino acid permease [Actinomycetota bacterium]
MTERRRLGPVTYREADQDYFDKRRLRRHAGVWSLWALGVAAVISGDFFGWNFGLAYGFGGLLVATLVITVMYYGLCFSIAEMSPALPHTGGAYSFARSAMGPWGGFATGVAETIEYVVTPAVVVVGIGGYMNAISDDLFGFTLSQPVWWLIFYAIFVGLNFVGVVASFRFTVLICFLSLAILAVFFIGAIPKFDLNRWAIDTNGGHWFIDGVSGVFYALPFAIWFYLAIEELPLAAEESADPKRDIPRGTVWGLNTLVVTGFLVLFLNSGIHPGAKAIGESSEPLLDGLKTVFGSGTSASLLGLVAVAGLVASFHTIIFAYGRNIFSLSRAGYYPHPLSVTHGTRQTPHVALILGAVLGWIAAYVIYKNGTSKVGASLLYMAVFGAVISYFMQCTSFIMLRRRLPQIARPYRSPVGVGGAAVAGVIALCSLGAILYNDDYRPGVYGVAIVYLVALLYFALAGRHRLVLSPEEEFAMTAGEHGHPEAEGYGRTSVGGLAEPDEAPVAPEPPPTPETA